MNILQIIKHRVKYHLILQSISDMFERVGIAIIPYCVFEESIADKLDLMLEPGLSPLTSGFLSTPEINNLCKDPQNNDLAWERTRLLEGYSKCFAIKYYDEIVSYMVCDLYQCTSRLFSFPLKEDEVYLSRAYTFPAYRGNNLAAFLEYELYKQLHDMGFRKYHSINILSNTPSLRFKMKLRSRPAELRLYIKLFKYQKSYSVKVYRR